MPCGFINSCEVVDLVFVNSSFVYQARLAESEAKLQHTVQAREKAVLLEGEVHSLKQRLAETEAQSKSFAELKEENKALQESLLSLEQSGGKGLLEAKYRSSLDEANSLKIHLADAQTEISKFFRGSGKEKLGPQEYVAELENKIADMENQLAEANTNNAELEALKTEVMVLQEEAAALRMKSAGSLAGGGPEDQSLQHQVRRKIWTLVFRRFRNTSHLSFDFVCNKHFLGCHTCHLVHLQYIDSHPCKFHLTVF